MLVGRSLYVGIQFAVTADQHRIALDVLGLQQGLQQSVLVLAISVTVLQDFRRGVGLQPANAEGNADVANVPGHVVVEAASLFRRRSSTLGKFSGLFAHALVHDHTVALQFCIPLSHLQPVRESGHLDIRREIRLYALRIAIVLPVRDKIANGPGIDSAVS